MDFVLLLFFAVLCREVAALRLISIDVPAYSLKGDNVHLYCRYDLETDKLYSVLWYKDDEEFYKFVNSDRSQHPYDVTGIKVDHRNSDSQKVILQRLTLDATGKYKCEVSGEGPHFASVKGEAYMEVIALPSEGPTITGEEKIYASGDILSLNCTTGKSYPPARITWFINSVEVKSDSETMIRHHDELVSTISSLRLELGPHHLSGERIDVRCVAVVQTSNRASKQHENVRDTHVFVQGHANQIKPCLPLLTATAAAIIHRVIA